MGKEDNELRNAKAVAVILIIFTLAVTTLAVAVAWVVTR